MFKSIWFGGAFLCASHLTAQNTNTPASRPITLEECIEMALEQNLDLRVERINPSLARLDLEVARAAYDPVLTFSATRTDNQSSRGLSTNGFFFANPRTRTDVVRSDISGYGPMGFNYSLFGDVADSHGTRPNDLGRNRFETSEGSVGINAAQPLLRNFLADNTRSTISLARSRLKTSEQQLRGSIIDVIRSVDQAYYELIFARESVKVQQEGLRLAERLYGDDLKRMEIGMIARLDEKQSGSQVAARQADVSAVFRQLSTAQNNLKRLISGNYRDLHGSFLEPTEKLTAVPQVIDVHESWGKGLEQRPDLQQGRLALEQQGITLKFVKNQRLPQLDITGSYGYNAGGESVREFPDAFGDIRRRDQPFWSLGAIFSIPLANKAARERYRGEKVTADQLLIQLKQLEDSALIEIDEAVNSVRTSFDRVQSTREARLFAEEALTAEQQKLQSGKSTSFVVLQLQRDLTSARSEEIRALADYNKALAELYHAEGTTLERKKISLEMK